MIGIVWYAAMHRLFADKTDFIDDGIRLSGENAKHLSVLRLKKDELFTVCDGFGWDYFCRVELADKDFVVCQILEKVKTQTEPNVKITLFQGFPKADKMELIIQKCVELGVYEIVPVLTENTVVKLNDSSAKKIERYNKISEAAAKQSGRGIIPLVSEAVSFKCAVEKLTGLDESYIAYEKETPRSLQHYFNTSAAQTVGFFIGPEGGFSPAEALACEQSGIHPVSLGKRILRTETAGFMLLITYLYSRGEF